MTGARERAVGPRAPIRIAEFERSGSIVVFEKEESDDDA